MGIGSKWYRKSLLTITGIPMVEKLSTTYGKGLASRFIAGETLEEALKEVEELGKLGIMATLDHLGEGIRQLSEAAAYKDQYIKLITGIADCKANSNVSLKPTQMGLALDPAVCYANIRDVVKHARRNRNFVRIDMENTPYTQATIDIVRRLHKEGLTNVGTVLQAYLFRSEQDAAELLRERISLRLVKGAYKESDEVAFQKTSEIIRSFKRIIGLHLENRAYTAIASHDDEIISWVKAYARTKGIPKSAFEFQMLYGLRMNEQAKLAKEGYRIRCYIPYGVMWYPYFTRRLAEKPVNLMMVLKHMSGRKR
ncbi:proline dehydrogenase family protein [Paenibacillus alkaliterrae]|uniref:proline dehydrogenase family protein n=1 Tax=Paenibacillus alkaliterrae TaxID=320909 RepID=UPI001F432B56|nr:proline dehydrogenase family protein [Paenibacillus alkaliterrae]MCF2940519.1 proline dehydrogenase family protein [Paenibacillus alkaliterrae]